MTMDKKANKLLLDMRDDHKELLLDILREKIPQLEVWAFGSRAKWTAREASDLDLVLRNPNNLESPVGLETIGSLKEIFDESDLPFMVDILDWATVSEKFRKVIEREYVVVQEPGKKGWKKTTLDEIAGSTFPNVSSQQLNNLEIDIPESIEVQARIASILSTLDDKIELNSQTNATLEAITQAIFKEWFVDFRFPGTDGEMEESELGLIPKGWRVGSIGDLFELQRGFDLPTASRNESLNGGSAVPTLNRNEVHKLAVIIPPRSLLHKFDNLIKPIFEIIFSNEQQTKTLSQIRNSLLPKLMNGEIEV